jgi:hypothetical protein
MVLVQTGLDPVTGRFVIAVADWHVDESPVGRR